MGFTFIHFSDSHLGFSDFEIYDEQTKFNLREEDVYNAFAQVIDYAISNKVDFLIHSGDIFHRSTPQNRALVFLTDQLLKLEKAQIPIYIIAGNHDFPKTALTTPIHGIYNAFKMVKFIFEEKYLPIITEHANLHFLPHINSEEGYLSELNNVSILKNNKPNIFITHVSMPSYLLYESGERILPENVLTKLSDFDYVALGHWHKFRHFANYGNTYYSGSTERISEKEIDYDKYFLIIEYNNTINVTPIKLNLRPIIQISVNSCYSLTKKEIINNLIQQINQHPIPGSIFLIKLLDAKNEQRYEITNTDLEELLKDSLFYRLSYQLKDSDKEIITDSESFDFEGYLFSNMKGEFEDENEFLFASKITKLILDEIEEEESNEN